MSEVVFLRSIPHFTWVNIAHMYGVSRTTIYRSCKEAGIPVEKEQVFSYEDLLPVLIGERLPSGMCRECCVQEMFVLIGKL